MYKVSIGTGTAWLHQETVEALNEQEAVDMVADKLIDSAFVEDRDTLANLCESGETVDEYAEAHGLVCCGNSGVYMELVAIEKISE